ncbi:hypothetical protein DFR50_110164 [Roseiarcus fermentans]|uniref:Uncharacterized protein n=1 Tax=Roseiarcus fermentans TaxID=1473586 RepID=A0A366FHJ9_9HYPH|nr:hypothetical protein [Roseiarcus fermentans]RBP14138.1 hypothetical protein DFR50_110164 [Roseiarcus fermentans]
MKDCDDADLLRDGAAFIAKVVGRADFAANGILLGSRDGRHWAVVDPRRHPLQVWRKKPGAFYANSARDLNAAIFTNGPMMGKRVGMLKITRGAVVTVVAGATAIGALAGLAVGRNWVSGLIGAAVCAGAAWIRVFADWTPCGTVCGRDQGVLDRRNFDDEADAHAWIGRFGQDFASYRIGRGDLPPDACEGLGGLVLLLADYAPASGRIGDRSYHRDFAQLGRKEGVVSWGLAPGHEVIAVIGGKTMNAADVAAIHRSIGARDAVAMDLNACSMMGSAGRFFIGPPPWHRQSMQIYGLCCK